MIKIEQVYDQKERIGKWLKEIRESRGWSRYKVTEEAGIEYRQLDQVEAGEFQYTAETLIKICLVYDIDPAQLLLENYEK